MTSPPTALVPLLPSYLDRQRWFASDAHEARVDDVTWHLLAEGDGWELWDALVAVSHSDRRTSTYQVPLGLRRADALPDAFLEGVDLAVLGVVETDRGSMLGYDATHDPTLNAALLQLMADAETRNGVSFRASIPVVVQPGRLLGTEQSNSSIVFGDEHILKLYRRLTPDPHPEVEVAEALTTIESAVVAPVTGRVGVPGMTLGLLQPFFRSASDGWALALGSVRSCLAAPVTAPEEDQADFSGESERLGATTARLHADLARALPSRTAKDDETRDTVAQLHARLTAGIAAVPALAEHADAIRAAYDALLPLGDDIPIQRIHGDYHLGQLLRVDSGWVVLDFEGEPARPVEERRALMSPLRDVAGMLRSFDYAAQHLLAGTAAPAELQVVAVAEAWADRNRDAFCAGYASVAGADPRDSHGLLRAFELDKAVYEAVYEAGHRASWLPIPLAGIARLVR